MCEHQKVSHFPSLQYFYFLVTNHTSLTENADIGENYSLSHSITFVLHPGEVQYSTIKFLFAPWLSVARTIGAQVMTSQLNTNFSIFLTYQWIQSEVQHCDGGVKF